jgi:hypothetical protein
VDCRINPGNGVDKSVSLFALLQYKYSEVANAMTIRLCRDDERDDVLAIINAAGEAYRSVIPADRWHEPYMPGDEFDRECSAGVVFWGYEDRGRLIGVNPTGPFRSGRSKPRSCSPIRRTRVSADPLTYCDPRTGFRICSSRRQRCPECYCRRSP